MPEATVSSLSENSQYHHYIPQFILRNFTHAYRPPKGNNRGRRRNNQSRGGKKNKLYPGEKALHIIDLSKDVPELTESSVRRTFGQADMYRDLSENADQQHLEKLLSKLESQVSPIITKIRKEFESGKQGVWISRPDRNMLRKFLFIMKYRGKTFHKRFVGDKIQGYVANDKGIFLKYMHEKGFQTPLDVWFHSIKVIFELDMDAQGNWIKNLVDRMYPEDAKWFIMHTSMMYLAMCTPSSVDAEFVLTENCYNVFEGPNTVTVDTTGETQQSGPWTNYHEFSPVSPKLMMILRSFVLPDPEEDKNEKIKKWRETMYKEIISQHLNPENADSKLADLPISKAQNSYTQRNAQGITFLDGEDGSFRPYHKFYFPFFKISTEHVHKINTILLENAQYCQAIAFTSQSALKVTIEHFLTLPADQGFKCVDDEAYDPKLLYLRKLERVLKQLGSHESLVYRPRNARLTGNEFLDFTEEDLTRYLPEEPSEFMRLYMKIGKHLTEKWTGPLTSFSRR